MDKLPEISSAGSEEQVAFEFLEDGSRLKVEDALQKNTQIFDWLEAAGYERVGTGHPDASGCRLQHDLGFTHPDP